ncbi:Nicotinate-nucleotide adenylyltransferase [Adhaeretor mobilis]|uniref:Probable nicotinate-nucleotide adenylyltransferase n=2 Tax=Adhaeretor mobilis TaxID=1930276 RepID=A0A517MZM1_9BACT|nr:Nicotinate-nucleotide adenylyltransferase [Adhaeretor mobilis]
MRIGILGGSFDPVHNGHLLLAESAVEQLRLDEIWFVPAGSQPLKPRGPVASQHDRLAMLELALSGYEKFLVKELEIQRGGVSYTVDTLREVSKKVPRAKLFFLMGADSLADIPKWNSPSEICELATLAVVCRPDAATLDYGVLKECTTAKRIEQFQSAQIEMSPMAVSSSAIREKISDGESDWKKHVPEEVSNFIKRNRVYS